MVKCKPAKKEHNLDPNPKSSNWVPTITEHPCFRCIRDVPARAKYDFVDECAPDVMIKMDDDELEALSKEVIQAVLDVYTYRTDWEELTLLGDCLARVYMHTITRGGFLNGMFLEHENVRDVIRIAGEKSMPAYGIVLMHDREISFPECWLNMQCS